MTHHSGVTLELSQKPFCLVLSSHVFFFSEIEADSFLGQEPQRSSSSSLKPFPSLVGSVSKSLSSVASEHSSSAESHTHFPSEPQLQAANYSPVPEFTKSFTGSLHTAKPTPVYADALPQAASVPTSTYNSFLRSAEESKPPTQTVQSLPPQPPSSLLFPNQAPRNFTAPSIFTPAPASFDSSPTQQTPYYQCPPSGLSPVALTPVQTSITSNSLSQVAPCSNQVISNISSSAIFTPSLVPVPVNNSVSNPYQSSSFSSPSNVNPVSAPTTPNTSIQPPHSSNWITPANPNQTFTNIPSPSVFPPSSSDTSIFSAGSPSQLPNIGRSNSSTPSILHPSPLPSISPIQSTQNSVPEIPSAPQQPLFSYFSPSQQPQQTTTVASPLLSGPPLTTPGALPPLTTAAPPVSGRSVFYMLSINCVQSSYTICKLKFEYTVEPFISDLGITDSSG